MPRLWQPVIALLGLVIGSSGAAAQTASDFYYHEGNLVGVVIRLDTIGIVPRSGATTTVDSAVAPYGLTLTRVIGGDLRLYALESWVARDSIFHLARRIETEAATSVMSAGPLLRTVAGRFGLVTTAQLIVQFRPKATVVSIDSLDGALGLLVVAKTPFTPNHFLLKVGPRARADVLQLAQQLSVHPLVEYAYPNFIDASEPSGAPTRSNARTPSKAGSAPPVPWHLSNDGSGGGTPGADIEAVDAWTLTQGSPSTVIAIIENGGFDVDHPDLAGNLWTNPGELGGDEDMNGFKNDQHGWNFRSCIDATAPTVTSATSPGLSEGCGDAELKDPAPLLNDHGTAVAGLAAGASGNAGNTVGASGVCPKCRLMLIRAGLASYGRYLAFLYAGQEKAAVINASWTVSIKDPIKIAIEHVTDATGANLPVVMSVHHDKGFDDPAACTTYLTSLPAVIAVAQTDDKDQRIPNTGYGPCMGLVAPGGRSGLPPGIVFGMTTTDVVSTSGFNSDDPTDGCTTDLTNLDYTECFGWTSAAAPLVSGTIGLMLSQDPSLTRQAVTDRLYATAEKVGPNTGQWAYVGGFNEYYGHGRLNAFCALGGKGARCPAPSELVTTSPACPQKCETTPSPMAAFELGARLGVTTKTDVGGTETVTNIPGSGPFALPVLYADWFPAAMIMIDLQFGGQFVTKTSGAHEHQLTGALQPNGLLVFGGGQLYAGPSVAWEARYMGGVWTTDWGFGGGLGYRLTLEPCFAIRLEGRYRYWTGQNIDELGLALGFGVLFN